MNVFYFPPKNSMRLPYHPGFLEENEEEMVLGKIRKIALTTYFYIVRAELSLKFETIYRIKRYVCNPISLLIIIHGDAIGLL